MSFIARSRRPVIGALGSLVIGMAAPASIATAAPAFDDVGYSTCTATTDPGPDQTLDDVTTTCCVNHGGVPAGTTYGIGCVAQVDNPAPDVKEALGGYYLVEAEDDAHARRLAERCPAPYGHIEIRPIWDFAAG